MERVVEVLEQDRSEPDRKQVSESGEQADKG